MAGGIPIFVGAEHGRILIEENSGNIWLDKEWHIGRVVGDWTDNKVENKIITICTAAMPMDLSIMEDLVVAAKNY
jgi:hypothetical protein